MTNNELIESALCDARIDKLAIKTTIAELADRNLTTTLIYRAAILEFKLLNREIRELEGMLE